MCWLVSSEVLDPRADEVMLVQPQQEQCTTDTVAELLALYILYTQFMLATPDLEEPNHTGLPGKPSGRSARARTQCLRHELVCLVSLLHGSIHQFHDTGRAFNADVCRCHQHH